MADSQISQKDLARLSSIGKFLQTGVSDMIVAAILYGVFLILFSASVIMFFRRKSRTLASYITFSTTVVTFLIATLDLGGRASSVYISLAATLRNQRTDISLAQKMILGNVQLDYPNIIAEWTRASAALIADFVIIWRLWIVIPEQRYRMTLVSIVLFTGSLVVSLVFLARISTSQGIRSLYSGGHAYNLLSASIIASFVTNAITTAAFGVKLWRFRSFLVKNGVSNEADVGGSRRRLEKVFSLIIETGFVFCILQLVYLVWGLVGATNATVVFVHRLYDIFYIFTSAIYPTLIVVLVNTQRSVMDSDESINGRRTNQLSRNATRNHLSFAVPKSEDIESQTSNSLGSDERGVSVNTKEKEDANSNRSQD